MPTTTRLPGSSTEGPEIVKWYTRARHFPQLIGKTPDGATIWGGPYTYTQVIGGVLFVIVGSKTTDLWGQFGLIGNALILAGSAYGLVLLLGRLPLGSRNPMSVGAGVLRAFSSPAQGHLAGGPVRIRRPHRARARLVIGPTPSSCRLATPASTKQVLAFQGEPAAEPTPMDRASWPTSRPRQHRRWPRPRWSRPAPSQTPPQTTGSPRLRPTPATTRSATRPAPALTGVQRLLASAGTPSRPDQDTR